MNEYLVKEIYQQYQIPQNLQKHMLRVGALVSIICNHWKDKIDKDSLIIAALFHDIAKPLSFDLQKQAQFGLSSADIDELKHLQESIRTKYGGNEHQATLGIMKELGCCKEVIRIVDNSEWMYIPCLLKNNETETLLLIYSDMRIGMRGILSLEERLQELKKRSPYEDFVQHKKNGKDLERYISERTAVDLQSVTDEELNLLFNKLLKLSV